MGANFLIDLPALKILREAIKAVPSVKYALGVLGIVAAVAIATAIGINLRITIIGTVVGMTLMVVLVVFASLSLIAKEYILWPALVMLWSSTVLFVVFVSLLLISAFFAWPLDLTPFLTGVQMPENQIQTNTDKGNSKRFEFGGYIYGENDEPLSTAVRLLDDDEKQIQERDSDPDGRVGFNISFDQRVAAIQCVGHGAPIPLSLDDYHKIKTTHHFELYLKTRRIKIQ
jgi:hypothetical protein